MDPRVGENPEKINSNESCVSEVDQKGNKGLGDGVRMCLAGIFCLILFYCQ